MATTHIFLPLAFEIIGSICSKALAFLKEFGRRLTFATDENRKTAFLYQRFSLAIQRHNAACFADTFRSFQCDIDYCFVQVLTMCMHMFNISKVL